MGCGCCKHTSIIMKSIDFEITKNGYTLKDAIVLEDDVVLTDDELEAIKQTRFDNWYAIITNPVSVVWQTDAEGNQVLDDNGNPIPVEA